MAARSSKGPATKAWREACTRGMWGTEGSFAHLVEAQFLPVPRKNSRRIIGGCPDGVSCPNAARVLPRVEKHALREPVGNEVDAVKTRWETANPDRARIAG